MWVRLAFAMVTLVALGGRAQAYWWCDPLHGYYPWIRSCPVPWRQVDPWAQQRPQQPPQSQQPRAATASPEDGTAPVPSSASAQPTFPSPVTAPRGDALDAWCQGSIIALNIAICTDNDLRAAAVQRLHAFDDAKARLTPDQQKTLAADQNGWAMSYGQSCGLHPETAPTLPLAPSVKDCLARAGQKRLAYLRSYGTPGDGSPSPSDTNPAASSPSKPPTDTPSTQQPAKSPAPPIVIPPTVPAANPAPTTDAKAPVTTITPAAISCDAPATYASSRQFGIRRLPSLGTLEGKTMAGSLVLGMATIWFWLFAMYRNARRQASR